MTNNDEKNMYGESISPTPDDIHRPKSPGTTTSSIQVQRTEIDTVIYFDLDRELTFADCIKKIRKMADRVSDDTVIVLFFIQCKKHYQSWLSMLWDYLVDTGRRYNVVFRGILPDVSCFRVEYRKTFNVSLNHKIQPPYAYLQPPPPDGDKFLDYLTEFGYKFEII